MQFQFQHDQDIHHRCSTMNRSISGNRQQDKNNKANMTIKQKVAAYLLETPWAGGAVNTAINSTSLRVKQREKCCPSPNGLGKYSGFPNKLHPEKRNFPGDIVRIPLLAAAGCPAISWPGWYWRRG
jgi:hypothetical protein